MTTSETTIRQPAAITVQLVGGPTAVFEIDGLRVLTDPTFDPPGDHPIGNRNLVKTIGHIDAVLLSHDQHPDNLDNEGRKLLPLLTSSADKAAQAAEIPSAPAVIPMHVDGCEHLTRCFSPAPEAFAHHGIDDRLLILTPGAKTTVTVPRHVRRCRSSKPHGYWTTKC